MTQAQTIAAIRYGYGPGQREIPGSADEVLASLSRGNDIAARYPVVPFPAVLGQIGAFQKERKARRAAGASGQDMDQPAREKLRQTSVLVFSQGVARILDTDTPFFERLSWFWADHFTAVGKNLPGRAAAPAYLDEAIRPHVTARFADMLKAVITHPFMLDYLDQRVSTGPNSAAGERRGRGLNENLARELLELHTLGVGADYAQSDVRAMAELLTGLTVSLAKGFEFRARMSEPGPIRLMGNSYGGKTPGLDDIYAALDDLARHPDTARHLARKLAVHFVADSPDPGMVDAMTAAYLQNDGDLNSLYAAMLAHPAAWAPLGAKAKQPFDFIVSSLVALRITGAEFLGLSRREMQRLMADPMATMGQPFMQARGPDGWPELAEEWITPQGLASRIAWATGVARFLDRRLPDPVQFLQATLGDAAGDRLTWAVGQSLTSADGVALILASAEFNRR